MTLITFIPPLVNGVSLKLDIKIAVALVFLYARIEPVVLTLGRNGCTVDNAFKGTRLDQPESGTNGKALVKGHQLQHVLKNCIKILEFFYWF